MAQDGHYVSTTEYDLDYIPLVGTNYCIACYNASTPCRATVSTISNMFSIEGRIRMSLYNLI